MSRIVFLPRVTINTHNGMTPVLNSPEWKEEGIFLNELFRLKDTTKFFIYHKINDELRIDSVGDSFESYGIYNILNDTPLPDGDGPYIWESAIDFSNIYSINNSGDSALRLILMDDTKLYSISLGKLLNDIPHAYRMDGDQVVNDSTFYATTTKNGFVRLFEEDNNGAITPFGVVQLILQKLSETLDATIESTGFVKFANALEISNNDANTLVSPSNVRMAINTKIQEIPPATTTVFGKINFATANEVSEGFNNTKAVSLLDASNEINDRITEVDIDNVVNATTTLKGIMRLATPLEVEESTSNNVAVTSADAIIKINEKLANVPLADTTTEGIVKFANSSELIDSESTIVSPANISAMLYSKLMEVPKADTSTKGTVEFASTEDISTNSNIKIISPANLNMLINNRLDEIDISSLIANSTNYGRAKLASPTEITNKSPFFAAVTPADVTDMILSKFNEISFNIDANSVFNSQNPVTFNGELENVSSYVDSNERINILTKFSTSLSQPSTSDGEILQVISNTALFKKLYTDGVPSETPLYTGTANELIIKWGAHSTTTKIDLTNSPFVTGLTGLVFERIYEDDETTLNVNEQIKFCIGRTLKLRVATQLGSGLIFAPTILSGDDIILNGSFITILDSAIDDGEYELEFESIDGLNIEYLGKKKILANQTIMRKYNTPLIRSKIWEWGKETYSYPKQFETTELWKDISCGQFHLLILDSNGNIWAKGSGSYGQLGLGPSFDTTSGNLVKITETSEDGINPISIPEGIVWKLISCGDRSSFAIDINGGIWSWGFDSFGTLGLGATGADNPYLRKVTNITTTGTNTVAVPNGTMWKNISCGAAHSVALDINGNLWSSGYNGYGELGTGGTTNRNLFMKLTKITINGTAGITSNIIWKAVSCGQRHTLAIDSDNNIWAWGYNSTGQLGLGNTNNRSYPQKLTQITQNGTSPIAMPSTIKWKAISAGNNFSLALDTDGNIWAWGNNGDGRLGLPNTGITRLYPQKIMSITEDMSTPISIPDGLSWKSIECGHRHSLALDTDGNIWAWGYNFRTLGFGGYTSTCYYPKKLTNLTLNGDDPIPMGNKKWNTISASDDNSCALANP